MQSRETDPKSGASANFATFALIMNDLSVSLFWCPLAPETNQSIDGCLIVVRTQVSVPHRHLYCTVAHELRDGAYVHPRHRRKCADSCARCSPRPLLRQPPDRTNRGGYSSVFLLSSEKGHRSGRSPREGSRRPRGRPGSAECAAPNDGKAKPLPTSIPVR